jgi:hypothetical protein
LSSNDAGKRVSARMHTIANKLCTSSMQYIEEKESLKYKEFALRQEKLSLVNAECMNMRKYDDVVDKLESEYMENLAALSNRVITTTKLAEDLNYRLRLLNQREDDLHEFTRRHVHRLMPVTNASDHQQCTDMLRMGTRIQELCSQMNMSGRECEKILMNILDGSSGEAFDFDY